MFTGIVSDLGEVRSVTKAGDTRFEFNTRYDTGGIEIGASICCSGACMTVIDKGPGWFAISASGESLSCTTMGDWREGAPVNFERSLNYGDEMGGHIVSGHVDAVATVVSVIPEGDSKRIVFEVPER
ncbi:MAG: riboflavin synthase, partial [Rhodospirillales bacterium]|nr:riboflavin synthase [Rhodospirillales bacterium]